MRCLGVQWQGKLHFAPPGIRESLSRAFMLYQDRLLRLYALNTWDSVRLFHFLFHKSRVYQGTDDPIMWRQLDTTLENESLIRRENKPDFGLSSRGPYGTQTSSADSSTVRLYPCNRYSFGRECICVAFVRQTIQPRAAARLQVQPAQLIRTISPLEEEGSDSQTFSITLLNRFRII